MENSCLRSLQKFTVFKLRLIHYQKDYCDERYYITATYMVSPKSALLLLGWLKFLQMRD